MDVDVVDGVTVMRMNHPPVNAMDLELVDAAVATIRDVDGPIVLTGTAKCFSAGVDLPAIVEGGHQYIGRFMTSATAAFFAVLTIRHRWSPRSTDMPSRGAACWRWLPTSG